MKIQNLALALSLACAAGQLMADPSAAKSPEAVLTPPVVAEVSPQPAPATMAPAIPVSMPNDPTLAAQQHFSGTPVPGAPASPSPSVSPMAMPTAPLASSGSAVNSPPKRSKAAKTPKRPKYAPTAVVTPASTPKP